MAQSSQSLSQSCPPLPSIPPPRFPPPGVIPRLELPQHTRRYPYKESVLTHVIGKLYRQRRIDTNLISKIIIKEICRFISGGVALYCVNQSVHDARLAKTPRGVSSQQSFVTLLASKGVSENELSRINDAIDKCQFLVRPFSMTHVTTTYRYVPVFDEEDSILGVLVLCVKDSSVLNLFHEKMWNDEDIGNIKDLLVTCLKYCHTPGLCTPETSTTSFHTPKSSIDKSSIIQHLSKIDAVSPSSRLHVTAIRALLGDDIMPNLDPHHLDLNFILSYLSRYTTSIRTSIFSDKTYDCDTRAVLSTLMSVLYITGLDDVFITITILDPQNVDTSVVFSNRRKTMKKRLEDILQRDTYHTLTVDVDYPFIQSLEPFWAIDGDITASSLHTTIRYKLKVANPSTSDPILNNILSTKKSAEREYKIAVYIAARMMRRKYTRRFRRKRILVICQDVAIHPLLYEVLCLWGCIPRVVTNEDEGKVFTTFSDTIGKSYNATVVATASFQGKSCKREGAIEIKTRRSSYVSTKHLFIKLCSVLK